MAKLLYMENDYINPKDQNPVITVIDTIPEHVRILGSNQRARDIEITNKAGIPAHRALWRAYKKSLLCKTVMVDEEIVAIWGVAGTFLGKIGKPWLAASPFVEDYPMKLAFRYRSEVKNMLKLFPILEDLVSVDDEKTIKLLEIIGFKFEEPYSYGPNGAMFMRASLERKDEPCH